jgi:hypothetical protein
VIYYTCRHEEVPRVTDRIRELLRRWLPGQGGSPDTSAWRRVATRGGELTLLLPSEWTIDPPAENEDELLTATASDAYEAPLLCVVRELGEYPSAKEYKIASIIFLQQSTDGLKDHGGGEWLVEDQEISWHCYSRPIAGEAFTFLCFYLVSGEEGYCATAGCPQRRFSDHQELLRAIGASMRVSAGG